MATITIDTKENIIVDRKFWQELKQNPHFSELMEEIEDWLKMEQAKKETQSFKTLQDYDKTRNA